MNIRKAANTVLRGAFKALNPAGGPGSRSLDFTSAAMDTKGAYSKSAVAYSCIRRISQDISGSPLIFLSNPDKLDSFVPPTHPVVKLFKNPAPYLSQEQFLQYISMWLQLRGEYFVVFDNPEAPTVMVPSVDPASFRTLVGGSGELDGFELSTSRNQQKFLPNELLKHRNINPGNPYRGLSPLASAAKSLSIDVSGDTLAADIVGRGGETSLVYKSEEDLLPEQEEELLTGLRARRNTGGSLPSDLLLSGGLDIVDPKFTAFDYAIFERMEMATQKITMVYGLSPSIIGVDEAPNYATFRGRMRVYWQQTLTPIISGMESSFDAFFAAGPNPVYVRWDRSKIAGLQEDQREVADTAKVLKDAGLPWAVIDSHLNMGLPLDEIPGAAEVMVPSTLAPQSQLLLDWQYLPAETQVNISASQVPARRKGLTQDEIKKRVTDPLTIAQRDRQLGSLERGVSRSWRTLNFKYRKSTLAIWDKAVKDTDSLEAAYKVFEKKTEPLLVEDMAADAVDDIQPKQIRAGEVGESSIETLVTREAAFDNTNTKQGRLSPKTLAEIMKRENLIVDLTGEGLFDPIMEDVYRVITDTGEVGELQSEVQRSLDAQAQIKKGFNNSANRAVTIARTEIGSAYNVGRFNEMKTQGFKKHEWLANSGDKDTRESHEATHGAVVVVGKKFQPVGLEYPQDPAGAAEDVINCRCLTLPVLEDD